MSKEEIRKLLGGYATNSLTESERKALYEAALDDQELFDALQQEEALKSLLADPVARAEIRQALDQPPSGRPQAAWRLRWWAWGGAVSAVAAVAVLFAVFWPNRAGTGERPLQIASSEQAAKAPVPAPEESKDQKLEATNDSLKPSRTNAASRQSLASQRTASQKTLARSVPPAASAPTPAPPVPAPAPFAPPRAQLGALQPSPQQGTSGAAAGVAGQIQPQNTLAGQPSQFRALSARSSATLLEPALRYSLLKRDANGTDFAPSSETDLKPGDFVRFQVSTAAPGRIILARLDDAGEWQRVAEVPAQANVPYTIPDSPIPVPATAARFRIALEPSIPQAKDAVVQSASGAKAGPGGTTMIEITIGGNK